MFNLRQWSHWTWQRELQGNRCRSSISPCLSFYACITNSVMSSCIVHLQWAFPTSTSSATRTEECRIWSKEAEMGIVMKW